MSNVSVREIIEFSAAAFGVTLDDLARHWRGVIVLPRVARGAAVLICQRHTEAANWEIARAMGWKNTGAGPRFAEVAARVADMAVSNAKVGAAIERIEIAIDELHEAAEAISSQVEPKPRNALSEAERFGLAMLRPDRHAKLSPGDLRAAYLSWCADADLNPLPIGEIAPALGMLFKKAEIEVADGVAVKPDYKQPGALNG